MTEQLTLKYRPQTFSAMVGQKLNSIVLAQMVKNDSVPTALLFSGPRGTGKTSAARILAMELNPDHREEIQNDTSLDVMEIDSASHGSVADMRALKQQLQFTVGAGRRVVILDEAHSITREGFNALLKTLEEPPANVIFVLVTTEPHKIPDTIISRSTEFEFRRVAPVDILSRLIHVYTEEGFHVSMELATKIAEVADGSVRDAIKNLDFVHRAGVTTVEEYVELTGLKDVGPLLFAALLTNDHAKIFSVLDRLMLETGDPRTISNALNDLITDLFILKSDGHVNASGQALEYRVKLAKKVSSESLFAAVQVLWDLKTKIRWTEDQRTSLAMCLVLVAAKLFDSKASVSVTGHATIETQVTSEADAPRVLSMQDILQS